LKKAATNLAREALAFAVEASIIFAVIVLTAPALGVVING
jgi:type III secretory pathway component EscS